MRGLSPALVVKLREKLPDQSAEEAVALLQELECNFRFASPRKTKLGDFKPGRGRAPHCISVNGDLHPILFLITFIHELAHLKVHLDHGRHREPHGNIWKNTYRDMLAPFVREDIFGDLLDEAKEHLRKAPAGWRRSGPLHQLLPEAPQFEGATTLSSFKEGDQFMIPGGRIFKLGQKRRTRYRCTDMGNGKDYLVHQDTPAIPIA